MVRIVNDGFEATGSHQGTATVAQPCNMSSYCWNPRHREGLFNLPSHFPMAMPHLPPSPPPLFFPVRNIYWASVRVSFCTRATFNLSGTLGPLYNIMCWKSLFNDKDPGERQEQSSLRSLFGSFPHGVCGVNELWEITMLRLVWEDVLLPLPHSLHSSQQNWMGPVPANSPERSERKIMSH